MSMRYKGAVISATPPTLSPNAGGSGAWTLEQQMQANAAGLWPKNGPFNYIEDVFITWLYTGNGSAQTITNGIDLLGKGGLVWLKGRSSGNHILQDTVRGANNYLMTDSTAATQTLPNTNFVFGSSGFSMNNSYLGWNANTNPYASWTFREQPKFFDVVTYTGAGNPNASRQIAHSLGSVPGFILIKATSTTSDWYVCARSGATTYATGLSLNSTAAAGYNGVLGAAPTSTYFDTTGIFDATAGNYPNQTGVTYVAYLFAHNAGGFGASGNENVISCGSYSGSGADGNSVNLGYEAQWVLIKNSSSASQWTLLDNMRGMPVTGNTPVLYPNSSAAEDGVIGSGNFVNSSATGFIVNGAGGAFNTSGNTYIYIAIRRGPMRTPTTGTSVYNAVTVTGNSTANRRITGYGFPLDLLLSAGRTGSFLDKTWNNRLNGIYYVRSTTAAAEDVQFGGLADPPFAYQDGYQTGTSGGVQYYWNNSGDTYVQYGMRRAPGFMDTVCYTGTGTTTTQTHNLQAVPELIIVKRRNGAASWQVYSATYGRNFYAFLDLTQGFASDPGNAWGTTNPTSTTFSLSPLTETNASGSTYVAYLFASVPGVSKVGSYTGTGTTQTINCGFTGGARFVLIKRTDSTGDWYVWDTARGMIPANDPYLLLNSTAAEVTGTDFVDTAATGFEITSTAPAAINANGGTFIFLAIA